MPEARFEPRSSRLQDQPFISYAVIPLLLLLIIILIKTKVFIILYGWFITLLVITVVYNFHSGICNSWTFFSIKPIISLLKLHWKFTCVLFSHCKNETSCFLINNQTIIHFLMCKFWGRGKTVIQESTQILDHNIKT